jgi:Mlc titration factor MtfA (ptsG expression regulator)
MSNNGNSNQCASGTLWHDSPIGGCWPNTPRRVVPQNIEESNSLFKWLTTRKRRRLSAQPFPDTWLQALHANFAHFKLLTPQEQLKLQKDLRILVAEKNWEGCRGLALTDEIKVTIAAQAALLVLGFENQYYAKLQSILVYPDAYVAPGQTITRGGLVLEGNSSRLGEAWYRGPVVFSWADALAGGRNQADGNNLVIHEFAHQLDMQNGRNVDGTPDLSTESQYDRWQQVIHSEFERLQRDCANGHRTVLDCYGATDIGEFFAVSTECFFERPTAMKSYHPQLYEIFRDFFRQDPARRIALAYG